MQTLNLPWRNPLSASVDACVLPGGACSAMTEYRANLRTAERLLNIGFWKLSLATSDLYWSPDVYKIYGLNPASGPITFDRYAALVHPADFAGFAQNFENFATLNAPMIEFNHRIIRPDGRIVWVRGIGERLIEDGQEVVTGVVQDITDMQASALAADRARDLIRMANQAGRFGGWRLDTAAGQVEWTEETALIHDSPGTQFIPVEDGIHFYAEEFRAQITHTVEACLEHGTSFDEVLQIVTAKNRTIWVRAIGEAVYDTDGKIIGAQGAFQDIDQIMTLQEKAGRLSRQLRTTHQKMSDSFFALGQDMCFSFANDRAEEMLKANGLMGRPLTDAFPPDQCQAFLTFFKAAQDTRLEQRFVEFFAPTGVWLRMVAYPTDLGLSVYFNDITEARARDRQLSLLEAAVAHQNEMLVIAEATPDGPGNIVFTNAAYQIFTGFDPSDQTDAPMGLQTGPKTDPSVMRYVTSRLERSKPVMVDLCSYRKDGTDFWQQVDVFPLRDDAGEVTHFVATLHDKTEARRDREALRISEERLRLSVRATDDVIWDRDQRTGKVWWSDAITRVFGYPADHFDDGQVEWVNLIHPSDRDEVIRSWKQALEGDAETWTHEYRFLRADGAYVFVSDRAYILRDEAGLAIRPVGSIRDISASHDIQERLRQSQKLEALGQLTGGVAHDSNNLLMVIIGNCDLLLEQIKPGHKLRRMVEVAQEAALRGADLNSRLLSFARRQPLHLQTSDINEVILGGKLLVRQAIPQRISIKHKLAADLWPCVMDRPGFETALLNVILNARDAMPDGGVITVETSNVQVDGGAMDHDEAVQAGPYVQVSIRDTGTGMSADVLARAFDPFFTTKAPGKGTGLGLSMIYGMLRQLRGHIRIESQPGKGTTIHMMFPKAV